VISARGLVKSYGDKVAVDDLSFEVQPGIVTGFLGPNGAGKSTTMRMIIGLDAPTRGAVTVNGKAYASHRAPLHEVGALLEARAVQNGRTARNHLLALASTCGISASRVDQLLDLVGLTEVASKRVGGFSLGMGQRLGIAAALLGDPATLILDEPVNGLDPEGILWIRLLLRALAREGRTVFVSSHLMSEMALTADHLIVIGRGKLIADVESTSAGYFQTMGIPLLKGREFSARDTVNAPQVVIVNDSLAKRYWPNEDAVGRTFKLGGPRSTNPWLTIVGVVRDGHFWSLDYQVVPQMFVVHIEGQTIALVVAESDGNPGYRFQAEKCDE